MLLLKLLLAPALVALATLATRRWGPAIGGLVVGFPLSAGPIFLFLTLDQGIAFAQRATVGILLGLVGVVAFALVYAATARRTTWAVSLASGTAAFGVAGIMPGLADWTLIGAALTAYATLGIALVVMPRPARGIGATAPAWWDLWVRMGAAALLTLLITSMASALGPLPSGILATFPVVSSVVLTFTHHQQGAGAALEMIRGSILSWFSFATFFLTIGLTLPFLGLAPALVLGTIGALASSRVVLWVDRAAATRRAIP